VKRPRVGQTPKILIRGAGLERRSFDCKGGGGIADWRRGERGEEGKAGVKRPWGEREKVGMGARGVRGRILEG